MVHKSAKTGGPAATPMNLIELYIEVMVPLCSFSIPHVINVSKQGKTAPMPIPAQRKSMIKNHCLLEKLSTTTDKARSKLPKKIIHFINTLFSLMIFPVIKEAKHKAPKGMEIYNPFLTPLYHIGFQVFLLNKIGHQIGQTS